MIKKYLILLSFIILCLLLFTVKVPPVFSQAPSPSPSACREIKLGNQTGTLRVKEGNTVELTATIQNCLRDSARGYTFSITAQEEGKGKGPPTPIWKLENDIRAKSLTKCDAVSPSNTFAQNVLQNPNCKLLSTDKAELKVTIKTTELISTISRNQPRSGDLSYIFYLTEPTNSAIFDTKIQLIVESKNAPTTQIKITSVSPDPANGKATVTVTAEGTVAGKEYTLKLFTKEVAKKTCTGSPCTFTFTAPEVTDLNYCTSELYLSGENASGTVETAKKIFAIIPTGSSCSVGTSGGTTSGYAPIPTPLPLPPPCDEWKEHPSGNVVPASFAGVKYCSKVRTGIGTFNTHPYEFVKSIFGVLLSISGGIAMLLIMYAGYKLMTSGGNPETIQGARETLTSAIVGLLFLIFSMVILQIIGVDILKIPGIE